MSQIQSGDVSWLKPHPEKLKRNRKSLVLLVTRSLKTFAKNRLPVVYLASTQDRYPSTGRRYLIRSNLTSGCTTASVQSQSDGIQSGLDVNFQGFRIDGPGITASGAIDGDAIGLLRSVGVVLGQHRSLRVAFLRSCESNERKLEFAWRLVLERATCFH